MFSRSADRWWPLADLPTYQIFHGTAPVSARLAQCVFGVFLNSSFSCIIWCLLIDLYKRNACITLAQSIGEKTSTGGGPDTDSDWYEEAFPLHQPSDEHPECTPPHIHAQLRRMRVGNVKLHRETLIEHLVAHVNQDRIHACKKIGRMTHILSMSVENLVRTEHQNNRLDCLPIISQHICIWLLQIRINILLLLLLSLVLLLLLLLRHGLIYLCRGK